MIASSARERAFTLVELLVVLGIIMVLVGVLVPGLMIARTRAKKHQTGIDIQRIKLALEQYASDFGDYPPSTLRDVGLPANRINSGIESLVACLSTQQRNGPYEEFDDGRLSNCDGDKVVNFNDSYIKKGLAYEYTDPWGRPLIYFHNRDYDRPDAVNRYKFPDGTTAGATPVKSDRTGNYYGLDAYQLWSVGPNGKNENGGGDDIASWESD